MKYWQKILTFGVSILAMSLPSVQHSNAAAPNNSIITDSRIKTLVYNENEVFNLITHYGYQSNIEFGKNETIQTISLGDQVGWQITPAGRRLFIKAHATDIHTNMTVITDKRTYQFDLKAREVPEKADEELVYVVRFFYPEEGWDAPKPSITSQQMAPPPVNPDFAVPVFNFNYTLTGDNRTAPAKVFDDGVATFFQMPPGISVPRMGIVQPDGSEMPVNHRVQGEYIIVDAIAPQFTLRSGNNLTCVFNENMMNVATK